MEVFVQRGASTANHNREFVPNSPVQNCFVLVESLSVRVPSEYADLDATGKINTVKKFGPQAEVRNVFSDYMLAGLPRDGLKANSHYKVQFFRPELKMAYDSCLTFMSQIGALETGAEGICFMLYQLRMTLFLNENIRRSCLVSLETQHKFECPHGKNFLRYPLVKHDPQKLSWVFDLGLRNNAIGPESLLVCFVPI